MTSREYVKAQIDTLQKDSLGLHDDVATPDDLKAIAAAREEYKRGETVSDNDINWD